MIADVRKALWEESRRKAWCGFTGLSNRMVDSASFRALRSVHSVKVLVYFWQMARYAKEKRRPGQDSPIGSRKKIVNWNNLSFEYRIAGYHGMRPDQFVKALRELFKYGFIDIEHHGRGIKGDWTRYAYSDRWRLYDTPRWKELPFPVADRVGWRATKKNHYVKPELSTTQERSCHVPDHPNDHGNAELKTPTLDDPTTTDLRSPSRSTTQCTDSDDDSLDLPGEKKQMNGLHSSCSHVRHDDVPMLPRKTNGRPSGVI